MIIATSVDSHFMLGDIKLEYWSKRLSKSSSLATLCNRSVLSVWLSCVEVMVTIASFLATSCDFRALDGVFGFLCEVIIPLSC